MSIKEVDRITVIKQVVDLKIKQSKAMQVLNLSKRQVIRLVKKYRQLGSVGLISRRRGQPSNNRHGDKIKIQVKELMHQNYSDFGPTLASEKLKDRHQIEVNKESLRQWMIEWNLWKTKRHKKVAVHQSRTRRSCFGELVQIDGSPHDWFEGRRGACCLLVFIDDATSRLLELRFEEQETTLGYFDATRSYIKRYGRPMSFYSDKYGVFRVNAAEAAKGTGETQFGRAMRELDIKIIFANSPQAKGRVERVNATLQDRLVKELRLRGISDIDTANAYLPNYIVEHNKRFSVDPANLIDMHRKSLPTPKDLDLIFTLQCERTLSKNLELSYQNVIYQIKTPNQGYGLRHARVRVCDNQKGKVTLHFKGRLLDYTTLDKKNRVLEGVERKGLHSFIDKQLKLTKHFTGHKPQVHHPWRQYELVAKKKAVKNGTQLSTSSTGLAST